MRELIELLKTKDHWECLFELGKELSKASENIDTIHYKLDETVLEARKELPEHLVKAFILIEVAKVKLSVMADEWNGKMDEVVENMMDDNKVENKFDDMDF